MKNQRILLVIGLGLLLMIAGYFVLNSNQTTSQQAQEETVSESEVSSLSFSPPTTCDTPTPQQTEGPYYKTGSPERNSLIEENSGGEPLIVTGYVFDENCQPVAGAWLDFWQADENGQYDNVGYKLRGHQYTDSEGRYYLETIVPARYSGRTAHIHVKIRGSDQGNTLTTQLYFPDDGANQQDSIFTEEALLDIEQAADQKVGYYNFVIDL